MPNSRARLALGSPAMARARRALTPRCFTLRVSGSRCDLTAVRWASRSEYSRGGVTPTAVGLCQRQCDRRGTRDTARVGTGRLPTRASVGRPVIVRRLGRGPWTFGGSPATGTASAVVGAGGNPTSVGAVETHQVRRGRRLYEVEIDVGLGLPGCATPIPGVVGERRSSVPCGAFPPFTWRTSAWCESCDPTIRDP